MDLVGNEEVAELAGVVTGNASEERRDFNNAGGFFVVGEFVGTGEERRIVLGDLGELVGADVVGPDLGRTVDSTRIFLKNDGAICGDGDVVEHHLTFASIQQHLDGAASLGIGSIGELQCPEAARGGAGASCHEVEGLAIQAPSAVFGAVEVGDASSLALGVESGAGFGFDITEINEAEGTAAVGEGEAGFGGLAEIADLLCGCGAGADLDAEQLAAGEAGLLDGVTRRGLVADVDVHLAVGAGVIEGHCNGLELFPGVGNDVLEGEVAEGGQFVDAACFRSGDDVGKSAALGARFLASEEDAAVVAGGAGLEGGSRSQIGRAEA